MNTKKKVLLVDDDADFVDLHKALLEKHGYEVAVAYNGEQCKEKVKTDKPDVILLDIMMATVGDGMFVAQDLRRDEASKCIPIVVVTSVNRVPPYSIGSDEAWLPVDTFIEKPVEPDRLVAVIEKMVAAQPRT